MTDKLWLDFETYSEIDIKTQGGMRYAKDDSTVVICFAYAVNDDSVCLWTPADPFPEYLNNLILKGIKVYAHNAPFDYRIWNNILLRDFDVAPLKLSQMVDTQALCATYALPLSLKDAGEAMSISMPKNKNGTKLIKMLCQPNKGGQPSPQDPAFQAAYQQFFHYCVRDVEAMRELANSLPRQELLPKEQLIWEATYYMNSEGLPIATNEARAIRDYVAAFIEREKYKIDEVSNGYLYSVKQYAKLKTWCELEGYPVPNTQAATITEALADPALPGKVRKMFELCQTLGGSATAKFKKVCALSYKDKVYDNLVYHGAGTGRWTGRGFQMHNLPRAKVKNPDELIQRIMQGETIEKTIASCTALVRPMIKAPSGKVLMVSDYSSIENRVLAWLAGDWQTLKDFKAGVDQYITMASSRYHLPYGTIKQRIADGDNEAKGMRQMGKIIILGCLAEGTLLFTNKGVVSIEKITTNHKVWDGTSWVRHSGLLNKGRKLCKQVLGAWMTKDHKIFISDTKKEEAQCLGDTQLETQAICLALGKLLSTAQKELLIKTIPDIEYFVPHVIKNLLECLGPLKLETQKVVCNVELENGLSDLKGILEDLGLSSSTIQGLLQSINTQGILCYVAAGISALLLLLILRTDELLNVKLAHKGMFQLFAQSLLLTSKLSTDLKIDLIALNKDVITQVIETTLGTEGEEYGSKKPGPKTGEILSWMYMSYQELVIKTYRLIESTTTSTTQKQMCDLLPSKITSKTVQTYDLLETGSLHRFMILTPKGPLLVSNCGFGMGWETFVKTAKAQFSIEVSDEEAKEAVKAYREKYHLIKKLWNELKLCAIRAVITGERQSYGLITFGTSTVNGTRWLAMLLPSGKCLYYKNPTIDQKYIPKFEAMGKVPTVTHEGRNPYTRKWGRLALIPGRITENACQGTAREIMAQGMLNVEERMPEVTLLGSVHDECLSLVDEDKANLKAFNTNLCDIPWAKDVPLNADGYISERYKKD